MKNISFKLVLLLIFSCLPILFFGQQRSRYKYKNWPGQKPIQTALLVTADGGLSFMASDIESSEKKMNGHVGIGYTDKFWNFRFKIGYETLGGSSKTEDIYFKANFVDASANFYLNVVDLLLEEKPHRLYGCVHAGLGLIFQRTTLYSSNGSVLYQWGIETKSSNAPAKGNGTLGRKIFSSQLGVEVDFLASPDIVFFLDYSLRFVDTKFLDGINISDNNDRVQSISFGVAYKLDANKGKGRGGMNKRQYNY